MTGNKALKEGMTAILPDKLGDAVRLAPAVADAGEKLYTTESFYGGMR